MKNLFYIAIIIAFLFVTIDFVKYPECYSTTWRYQLENDIKSGNAEAIDYYNRVYIENGRILFE